MAREKKVEMSIEIANQENMHQSLFWYSKYMIFTGTPTDNRTSMVIKQIFEGFKFLHKNYHALFWLLFLLNDKSEIPLTFIS